MDDEKLIELVRQHQALYDLTNPRYMDSRYKLNIWKDISEELKVDATLCKTRWNNIRDNYRKSLRKAITKSDQTAKKLKMYKYSEQLQFLHEFLEEKKIRGNTETTENQDYTAEDSMETTNDDFPFESVINETNNKDTKDVSSTSRKQLVARRAFKRTILQKTSPSTSRRFIKSMINNKNEIQSTTRSPIHPVDAFLAGIAPTLKTLNPYYLNLAKSEIFSTVQKYEMEMLMQQQDPLIEDTSGYYNTHSKTPSPVPTIKQSPTELSDIKVSY